MVVCAPYLQAGELLQQLQRCDWVPCERKRPADMLTTQLKTEVSEVGAGLWQAAKGQGTVAEGHERGQVRQ